MNRKIIFFIAVSFVLFSCTTVKKIEPEEEIIVPVEEEKKPPQLSLLFAGDIMAHTQNFSISDYSKIWSGIKHITRDSDFSFANIETPVCDSLPYSSYPSFNIHSNYVEAAIDAGFNVFSLANNHSNDQYLKGINATIDFSKETEKKYSDTERKVYFAGLREAKAEFSYSKIEKDGWKILFVPVTQLLNRNDYASNINYIPSKTEDKNKFLEWCKKLKTENPCDLFILSLHTNEPEYIRSVSKTQENWYNQLLDSGIDIIWANHAHLIKKQKLIKEIDDEFPSKLVMYANGNTISGQRTSPNLDLKYTERDDTGDGLLFKIIVEKNPDTNEVYIKSTERFFVTTYINTANEYILKTLDDDFINYLVDNRPKWKNYIESRKELCENIPMETQVR